MCRARKLERPDVKRTFFSSFLLKRWWCINSVDNIMDFFSVRLLCTSCSLIETWDLKICVFFILCCYGEIKLNSMGFCGFNTSAWIKEWIFSWCLRLKRIVFHRVELLRIVNFNGTLEVLQFCLFSWVWDFSHNNENLIFPNSFAFKNKLEKSNFHWRKIWFLWLCPELKLLKKKSNQISKSN